ncbi:NADH pyrophosphatase [Pontiella desulfatans]|uniref:NAD-capped RNA hydrolase NudC n=1 Tax=Pontiella desulfatans TaxID=2750659 RepID=A0A6C2TZG8_PONDE|nr:NAD(+) diphosphatase [Pontiella desulfatans]VGO12751.1 NADH pyrophosphatase [Pontiella desulfatans]
MKFNAAISPRQPIASPVLAFLFLDGQIVVENESGIPRLPPNHPLVADAVYLGKLGDQPCIACRLHAADGLEEPWRLVDIRPLHSILPEELYALVGHASQILTWRENHRFCSKCGATTTPSESERAMVCKACGFMAFPRISPSMIVAVRKGQELLMARGPHFPAGLYSVVAGFLEPGETLEQCVAREVREETGIEIKNIHYAASQPWPFPHSIMIGFTADYAGGEIKIDPDEIEDAGWYTPETMPDIPSHSTIARWLIDGFLATSQQASRATKSGSANR